MTPACARKRATGRPAPAAAMRGSGIGPAPSSAVTILRFVAARGEWIFDCGAAFDHPRPGRMPTR